ncbi:MAG: glycine cleavage system aminomethyltransferase GcvT [Bernardetiaceae bacterium]
MPLKRTALYQTHARLGAKLIDFAGFEMPVRYTSQIEEHHTVRERVGIFDVSHMGEFFVSGPKAEALIQYVTSNDVSRLKDGQAQYSCLPNDKNGIVDDLLVYRLGPESFMLVVNGANIEKDWQWITAQNANFGAVMADHSDQMSLFAVQGPLATAALQPLTELALDQVPYYHFTTGTVAGIPEVIVSATGYTGSGGFELYVDNAHAETLWEAILESGAAYGIQPIGLAARDTLRMEMGFCLYGNDIDDTTSPFEAGLGWITKPATGFLNAEALQAQKAEGLTRRLVGLRLDARGIPRQGYAILDEAGQTIGTITSGTQSPSLGHGIGMGYIQLAYAKAGTSVAVQIRNQSIPATVVKLPFYQAEKK